MSLKKCGVFLDCGHCECVFENGGSRFEVTVPLTDIETGLDGTARLRCCVSAAGHEVELKEWNDAAAHPIKPSVKIEQRVSAALDYVADHGICGNQQICPAEVVRIVERQSRR